MGKKVKRAFPLLSPFPAIPSLVPSRYNINNKQDNYEEININISSNGINSKSGFWPVWKMWL